jgi:putative cell wall-binding protein
LDIFTGKILGNEVILNKKKWSKEVTEHSHALALEEGVFTWKSPKKIAKSLSNSAEESTNRKGTPFQSAMSMLNFYINRAGKNLSREQKDILEQAKIELRKLYNK